MSKVTVDGILSFNQSLRKTLFEVFILTLVVLGAYAIFSVNGCANYQQSVPETPEEVYLKARMTFNGLLADYVDQKRMADNATRARWTNDIDPWFERGAAALAVWGDGLKAGGSTYGQQQAYLEVKNQLLQIMLKELAN